jgi:hypothetical protein
LSAVAVHSIVDLPRSADPPYRVFVNGVLQGAGDDYDVDGRTLVFHRELVSEGKLGFWRWTLMFFSIAGTYRRDDSVDVQYLRDGREQVATGLGFSTVGGHPDLADDRNAATDPR